MTITESKKINDLGFFVRNQSIVVPIAANLFLHTVLNLKPAVVLLSIHETSKQTIIARINPNGITPKLGRTAVSAIFLVLCND